MITFVLKHLQNENKPHLHGLMQVQYTFRQHTILMNVINEITNL